MSGVKREKRYNDPFYFALPRRRGNPNMLSEAIAHIEATFGVTGTVEMVRTELAFRLFRLDRTTEAES